MGLDKSTLGLLLGTVQRFVNDELIPAEVKVAHDDEISDEIVEMMRELGLFGLSVPEVFGGMGLCVEDEIRVMFELGRASPAFRSLIATNVGIGSQGIVIDGTEEQKKRLDRKSVV